MKLQRVIKSTAKGKKWTAIFDSNGKEKKVHFGQEGATDYTKGATDEQRKSYRARHAKEKSQPADVILESYKQTQITNLLSWQTS